MINREQMAKLLIDEFPSIEEDITEDFLRGLAHLEVAVFARYTNAQIESHNESELARCFEVAHKLLVDGDDDLDNAIHVSYLELLDLDDRVTDRSWARRMMSEPLLSGYEAFFGPSER